jgi:2-phosphosulfolactate phosphatase
MKMQRANLETCAQASGAVVAIDVLRAFSTAAYAFAAGVDSILLVSTVDEALALRQAMPGSLAMGEVEGIRIPEFDFGNSPPQFDGLDLSGRILIQRTTAGTQGVVRSQNADLLLAASFCTARPTAELLRRHAPAELTFVLTGLREGGWGDEDAACADYLEAVFKGESLDLEPLFERVRNSAPGRQFTDPDSPDFPLQDLEYCLQVDRFPFAMQVERQNGRHILRSVFP